MKVNVRADSVEIEGYVNAIERNSKPLMSRIGRFIERICKGAFNKALKRNDDIHILLNHDWNRDLGSTKRGNLELTEDNIGLYARACITDSDVIQKARNNELVGWSFGFQDRDVDNLTYDGMPYRAVKDLDLFEVSILDRTKSPAYDGTLITARSETNELQFRGEDFLDDVTIFEGNNVRFNPNHDSKTGQFAPGHGSSGGSSSGGSGGKSDEEKIKALEEELGRTSRFSPEGKARRKEIQEELDKLKGNTEKTEPTKKSSSGNDKKPSNDVKPVKVETSKKELPVTQEKEKQFDVIQKTNKMTDEYHTGIRKPSDIKSATEAFKTNVSEDDDFLYPDFTKADGEKALETGKITVYSSKPIGQGGFVSPSKMMAQDYAGSGEVFSKTVDINDVAWIDSNEGQFAKVRAEDVEPKQQEIVENKIDYSKYEQLIKEMKEEI